MLNVQLKMEIDVTRIQFSESDQFRNQFQPTLLQELCFSAKFAVILQYL
jgi:hypothetical protein